MADKNMMSDLRSGIGNAKTRSIFIVIVVILLIAIVIGYIELRKSVTNTEVTGRTGITGPPGVRSIPGVGQTTRQYVKLQQEQNLQLAQQAMQKGTASIPVLTRATYLGDGSVDFSDGTAAATAPGCGIEELRRAREAGVSAFELRCRGCSAAALKAAGYTSGELRASGFTAKQLADAGFTADQLKNSGFSAQELKDAGFSAAALKAAGFSAGELRDAGFSADQLKATGFSAKELKDAGYSDADLAKAGFSSAEIAAVALDKDCSVSALSKARAQGVSAAQLKQCGAAALKAAGYTAAELKAAGFTAAQLKDAGFTAKELKDAGFSAKDLKDAGFSAGELKDAGFSEKDLKDAGFSANDLKAAGFSAGDLKDAGFSAKELKDAGFTNGDLTRAGFSPAEIIEASIPTDCSIDSLRKARANGVSASKLKKCGAAALRAAGYSAKDLKDAGFTAAELKAAGFSAKDLKDAGFTAAELKTAGFSDAELAKAGFSPEEIAAENNGIPTGCSVSELRRARLVGVSASKMKQCGAAALRTAGFSAKDLKDAGFTAAQLKTDGFPPAEIARASLASPGAGHYGGSLAGIGGGGNSIAARLAALEDKQGNNLSDEQRQQQINQMQANMITQAGDLFASWTGLPTQQYVAGQAPVDNTALDGSKAAAGNKKAEDMDVTGLKLKAGSIFFAVLNIGINSDTNSPVMATIVSGKLKGAKLLGSFERQGKVVILRFNVLSVPYLTRTISINAYAIDPNTAKTALATSVDNHYMLRYGSLFATSFLQGFGQSVQTAGSQITIGTGGIVVTHPSLTLAQQALVGLGQVGQNLGTAAAPQFNTPPTVEVKAGSAIGLLIMSDLTVPEK